MSLLRGGEREKELMKAGKKDDDTGKLEEIEVMKRLGENRE